MRDEFDFGFTDAFAEFRRMRSEVKSGFADVRQELVNVRTEMKAGLGEARQELTSGLDDLRRESRAVQAGDAAVREDINARLEPIEAAIRSQARRKKLEPRR